MRFESTLVTWEFIKILVAILTSVQCRYKLPHSLIWTHVLGILIMQKEKITLCLLICLSLQANVTSQKSIWIRMIEISYYISMISAGIISKNNASSVSIKIFYIFNVENHHFCHKFESAICHQQCLFLFPKNCQINH